MKKLILFVLLSVCAIHALEKGQIARFHRILRQFEYSGYRASDRDIHINFDYRTNDNQKAPSEEDITSDALRQEDFSRDIYGSAGFTGTWLRSSALVQMNNKIDAHAAAGLYEQSVVTFQPLTGIFDSSESIRSNRLYSLSYILNCEKHFRTRRLKDFPFIGIGGYTALMGSRESMEKYRTANRTGQYQDVDKEHGSDLYISSEFTPIAGFGKMRPVRPIYQAFEIERNLKATSAISAPLSDQTILKIAELNGSIKAYQLRNEQYRKFLMKRLEEIIKTDSAVIDSSLDAYALFKVYETFETEYPEFLVGFSGYVKASAKVRYERWRYSVWEDDPWDDDLMLNEGRYWEPTDFGSKGTVDYYTDICLSLCYPVVNRLFLSIVVSGPTYPTIDGAFYLMLTNRLFIETGIDAVWGNYYRTSLIEGYCDVKLYIENHLYLTCNLKRTIQKKVYQKEFFDIKNRKQSEGIRLGVNYDF